MRVAILSREERDGAVIRKLACGHEQPDGVGPDAHRVDSTYCRRCAPARVRPVNLPVERPPALADTRTELQRLADHLEAVYVFPPGRAWGLADVAVRKLIDAARKARVVP